MALYNVNRIQDLVTANVADITPQNWHRFPSPISKAMTDPVYIPAVTYTGGVYGDDVDTATAATTVAYAPTTQAAKAALPGASPPNAIAGEPDFALAVDITRPRGWLEPDDPYVAPPATPAGDPTISSLAPNTAVAGSPSPLAVVVTGTNFTPWSTLETGGVSSPYVRYESPTKLTILMDPKRSSAGIVVVKVVDHGVKSAGTNFTYT